ncbi:uncharacterized protein LOC128876774 [Hylaeus volcanicus]|uniref:uncharacterized protein LOC128876774 n=1 Tax=Hylaeus volcanicus TaxID=313075 RepID=UPI0023B873C1|nr:uncharacterized protein LOC128876774 [Hylaeus volcanicus]
MHPTAARSNRSSLQSSIPSTSTPSQLLHPQQQQILYGPIVNPMLTLQPCGTGLHPSCIYPGAQRNAGLPNPIPLHIQGKGNRWLPKNKLVRNQQYCQQQQQQQQQQHIQQQLSYNLKPLVVYDQTTNNAPPAAPTASFLVASSTYTHGTFTGDQYNSGVALVPQPYYKAPEVPAYCLVQDQQNPQQQQPPEQPSHGPYYNISANNCNLQTVNTHSTYQFSNLSPYTPSSYTNNQVTGPVQPVQSQIFPNPAVNVAYGGTLRDKPSSVSHDVSAFKCTKSKVSTTEESQIAPIVTESYEWPFQAISTTNSLFDAKLVTDEANQEASTNSLEKAPTIAATKTQEEHYSDESSASFDFAIDAEKMVSALCNTSSNELCKEETKAKPSSAPLFSGAGDTISNKNAWFADFCRNYGTCASVAIQTDDSGIEGAQYPELLRKIVYWGCTEAEIVLNDSSKVSHRSGWLKNLSAATKTAVTKSSTCFPIFAGDHVFVGDLINALLRISNGWLILDNYLNKQHYPSLEEKFDQELIRCFQSWERNTHELLDQIVQTFLKVGGSSDLVNVEQKSESFGTFFPGDVSVYTNCDLFDPSSNLSRQESVNRKNERNSSFNGSLRVRYDQEKHSPKESKSRSKWTVAKNLAAVKSTKFVPDMFLGHAEAGIKASSRFRSRACTSSKVEGTAQSLNAEFFHLRSKVLTENNQDYSRQWTFKERKQEYLENKTAPQESPESIFRLQRQLDESYENNYAQKCLSRVESSFLNPSISLESMYFTSNNDSETFDPGYSVCPSYRMDYGERSLKNFDQSQGNKANVDLVYVGKSPTSQLELAAVPKDKMTLLSQIEPSVPDKSSEEMTANLSAWFASMRNPDSRQMPFVNLGETKAGNVVPRLQSRQELPKTTMDLGNCIRQLQIDANRQFQTLQNMQSIQSAPWNAYNLINNRVQAQVPEEYDSSEDGRVYMKPGSYNVPKKRHQRRSNRRLDNSAARNVANTHRSHYANKEKPFGVPTSSTPVSRATTSAFPSVDNPVNTAMKLPFPATPIVPPPAFSLENSPRILKRSDGANYAVPQDVTWRAACASAEILLEALNVKDDGNSKKEKADPDEEREDVKNAVDEAETQLTRSQEKLQKGISKALKEGNDEGGASSYEASEDDSGSTCRFSPDASVNETLQSENRNSSSKTNVKTDSWLIRTLNNASMVNKQKRRENSSDRHSSGSSNSSAMEDEQTTPILSLATAATTVTTTATVKSLKQTSCTRKSCTILNNDRETSEEFERVAGKATYSETVRRCTALSSSQSERKEFCKKGKLNTANATAIGSPVIPIPGRRCQRKDPEKSYYLLHNRSRKCSGKKATKRCEVVDQQAEEMSCGKFKLRNDGTKENSLIVPSSTSQTVATTKHGKKKDGVGCVEFLDGKYGGKSGDRGWSVWYSSKRKQSLSPLALSKLEMIHRTVWQMEEAEIFKCPSSGDSGGSQSSAHTIEDYCTVIKSPMFLETVEYKLKNRVYHKVEHAVRDFRRIVYNSKLYHKNDHDRVKTIETLSKKLEELFEEHFASWDFDNISGSPREVSPVLNRFKSAGKKTSTGRYGNAKRSPSSSVVENV